MGVRYRVHRKSIMSLVLAAALAASTASLPSCSWDRPGVNPFVGDVVAAVDRYADIPAATRAALKARMAKRQYDDLATITRDGISGQQRYTDLRDMHFGAGRVCQTVTRDRWTPSTQERGLVYCEDGHCIIVPTVCRNVSRVTREPQTRADNDGHGGAAPESPQTVASLPFPAPPVGQSELRFEAPSAGISPSLADGLREPLQALALATPGLAGTSGGAGSAAGSGGDPPLSVVSGGGSSSPGSFGDRAGVGSFPSAGGIGGFPGTGPIVTSGGTGGGAGGGTGPGDNGTGGTDGGTGGSGGTGGGTGGGTDPGGTGGGTGGTDPGGTGGGGGVVIPSVPGAPPVSPIPEPSTWVLMLGGLAVVGAVARRRGRQLR